MNPIDEAIIFYFGSAELARRHGKHELAAGLTAVAESYERIKAALL